MLNPYITQTIKEIFRYCGRTLPGQGIRCSDLYHKHSEDIVYVYAYSYSNRIMKRSVAQEGNIETSG